MNTAAIPDSQLFIGYANDHKGNAQSVRLRLSHNDVYQETPNDKNPENLRHQWDFKAYGETLENAYDRLVNGIDAEIEKLIRIRSLLHKADTDHLGFYRIQGPCGKQWTCLSCKVTHTTQASADTGKMISVPVNAVLQHWAQNKSDHR